MDKCHGMKSFVVSAREYLRHRTEAAHSAIQRQLQLLASSTDTSIFDPNNSGATEFYTTLHELMYELESRSPLLWHGINVLQHACQNSQARNSLIHTYKFTPVLTKLLGAHLIHEKRLRVLQLLQELTYGIKISWREAHLPALIATLTDWVTGNEKDVVTHSLGILVNICYKNLPAIYQLMRSVDVKEFLKSTLNMQNKSVYIKVHVSKLLIILQEATSEIPDSDILDFVEVSFISLQNGFKNKDIFLMRHVIDFFSDVKVNGRYKEVLLKYQNYFENVRELLLLVDETSDPTCVGMIFEFIDSIVTLQIPGLACLYNETITYALQWLASDLTRSQALNLIRTIIIDKRREMDNSSASFNDDGMISQLEGGLNMMIFIIDSCMQEELSLNSKSLNCLGILLQLLKEMSKVELLKVKILPALNIGIVKKLFQPFRESEGDDNLLQRDLAIFYVQALDFVSCIAPYDAKWLELFSNLLQLKQVHMVLAIALLTGTEIIKKQVLQLIGTVSRADESVCSLAKQISALEPLLMMPTDESTAYRGMGDCNSSVQDMAPLLSLSKENRLDVLISKLEEAVQNNKIKDISTSAIMELYEYKLAVMQHSEHALQSSLEAASNFSTHLQQKLVYVSTETSKLHKLLFNNQQALEELTEEKKILTQSLKNVQEVSEKYQVKLLQDNKSKEYTITQLTSQIDEFNRTICLRNEEIKTAQQNLKILKDELYVMVENTRNMEILRQQYDEKVEEAHSLEAKLKELANRNSDSDKLIVKMEEKLVKRERKLEEKNKDIKELLNNNKILTEEICNLNLTVKASERTIQEKEEQVGKLQNEIKDLSLVIEKISKITSDKKLSQQ